MTRHHAAFTPAVAALLLSLTPARAAEVHRHDLVVYGGTAGGYDAWADLGQQQTAPAGQPQALDLRRDMAVHHDTVATYVAGGEARR